MRIRVKLGRVTTHINYNKYIQAIIYNCIGDKELHDKGYVYKNCSYKPFVFSRLQGRYKVRGNIISFRDGAYLEIGLSGEDLAEQLVRGIELTKDERYIGGCKFDVKDIEIIKKPELGSKIRVKTLSPVTAYKIERKNRKVRYNYIKPDNEEHVLILKKNLIRKHRAIFGEKYNLDDIDIKPLGKYKKEVVKYEGIYTEGYMTNYLLEGEESLIKTAYNCGLGVKNAQGFGCLKVV